MTQAYEMGKAILLESLCMQQCEISVSLCKEK